ncbi:EthD domain-containing protein [Aspergillus homomorphus CBS 101889]|uniref:EthD domain-containing protein n=1 Tax=Aspergillus homomorphus (strain CBS 101889) TaxID=1450537 RepID=A0A395HVJ1_ASPHC|nr:hypothetical protein BO97DRAFT_407118 [Aspergillus homomorphus CBS 101889]RAL10234.1 hypothetical protein BO97DRAFT_407118 [Aspergillus homomorphus CBS 101889]
MPLTLIVFLQRKSGTTPEFFKDYYENQHIPLAKEIARSSFPTHHRRHYLVRHPRNPTSTDPSNANYVPNVFAGEAEDFTWDVYVEMIFEDMQHLQAFRAALDAQRQRLADDEKNFMDRSKVYLAEIEGPFGTGL